MSMRVVILAILMTVFCSVAEAQVACPYATWTDYRGTTLLKHPSAKAYLYASSEVKVDADGAPNAYHPDDVGLNCRTGTGFKGLDCPANAGYPNASWWRDALVADPDNANRAFVQPGGPFAGFFVSMTSLEDPAKAKTNPARYVDSTAVPYIVFPRSFYEMNGTGRMGDLGYAVNLDKGVSSPFVVAEIGPSDAILGEMSIALAEALGGSAPNPRTGAGSPAGKILYVVFPKSSRDHPWPLAPADLAPLADALLNEVGGADAATACRNAL